MIVTVEELKITLGIPESDTSQDASLEQLIVRATAWVQEQTHRRFDTPETHVDVVRGRNTRELFLSGHVDPAVVELESAGELGVIHVRERTLGDGKDGWSDLVEDEDYERREDVLYGIRGFWWSRSSEYEVTFLDGWVSAPDDIKALITELASGQYGADAAAADGTAGITSEKLGDFSYSLDGGSTGSSAGTAGGGVLSDIGRRTLGRWWRPAV
jgi:hypothetical protein